jgi:site-specific recombinase XerD
MATFSSGRIRWRDFRSRDVVRFVTSEFCHLPSRETQRAWLMVLLSVLRYLAEEERISAGWDAALPSIANPQHAQLPRGLSEDEVDALWRASEGKSRWALRNRARGIRRTPTVSGTVPFSQGPDHEGIKLMDAVDCRSLAPQDRYS